MSECVGKPPLPILRFEKNFLTPETISPSDQGVLLKILPHWVLVVAMGFSACAMTPEARVERAKRYILKQPFEQWPSLYAKYENNGTISPEVRKQWMESWTVENNKRTAARIAQEKEIQKRIEAQQREERRLAAERQRMWDSLTPAQKLDFHLRQQELEQQQANLAFQAEAQRRANVANALNNMSQALQNQQMINAYDRRTQALSQPVNVNVNGNINHTFNPNYVQPFYTPRYSY
jgi:hypothetical protein